ncbi:hypothetical protein SAMN05444280_1455 [Tangfeifania diversioriginum]|uniref:Uncharacterized protein n=1 Tax=Tangfeifania diversioriginum TaxID=1168035 RepID=A0A1M6NQV1_9BACT|nr:DUF6261 family protein [Tangfeifania diversioriginum]SHJ98038.1 hypothetical protein SAMN05444280_1455 [Tangfeifania diversioriginum]
MIDKILTNSRVTEVDAATGRIVSAYKNTSLSSDTHLAAIFAELEPATERLTAAINQSRAESVLDEKDAVRDEKFRGLFYLVSGFVHHPDPAIKAAANEMEELLNDYGLSVVGESYAIESSLIQSLLTDLAKPKYQSSIEALSGCAELIAALQTAQADFEQARVAYEEEKAREGNRQNATEVKKEVLDITNDKLVVYLRAMIQLDDATFGDFGRTVGEIIAENNETVKRRRKKPEPEV